LDVAGAWAGLEALTVRATHSEERPDGGFVVTQYRFEARRISTGEAVSHEEFTVAERQAVALGWMVGFARVQDSPILLWPTPEDDVPDSLVYELDDALRGRQWFLVVVPGSNLNQLLKGRDA
jgi:hypothetical protein